MTVEETLSVEADILSLADQVRCVSKAMGEANQAWCQAQRNEEAARVAYMAAGARLREVRNALLDKVQGDYVIASADTATRVS